MAKSTRNERLQILLDEAELSAIDNWRFEARMPSRAAAIRELIGRGLHHDQVEIPSLHVRSTDIGVLDSAVPRVAGFSYCIADPNLPDCPLIHVSPGFEELTGYSSQEALGRNCRFLQGSRTDRDVVSEIANAIAGKSRIEVDILNYRKDKSPFWNRMTLTPVFKPGSTELQLYIGEQILLDKRPAA